MHGHDLSPLLKRPSHAWPHPVLTVLTGEKYGSDTDRIPTDRETLYKPRMYLGGFLYWMEDTSTYAL